MAVGAARPGARTATGSTSSANSFSMSLSMFRLMSIAYISGGSSRTSGKAGKTQRPPGSDPDGLGADALDVVLYVGCFPRRRAGRLIAVSFMKLLVMSDDTAARHW